MVVELEDWVQISPLDASLENVLLPTRSISFGDHTINKYPTYVFEFNGDFPTPTDDLDNFETHYDGDITKVRAKYLSSGISFNCAVRAEAGREKDVTCWGRNTFKVVSDPNPEDKSNSKKLCGSKSSIRRKTRYRLHT